MSWSDGARALFWGSICGSVLPLASTIALIYSFSAKNIARAMAFGGGALLFALSSELYSLDHSDDPPAPGRRMNNNTVQAALLVVTSIVGGVLFLFLDNKIHSFVHKHVHRHEQTLAAAAYRNGPRAQLHHPDLSISLQPTQLDKPYNGLGGSGLGSRLLGAVHGPDSSESGASGSGGQQRHNSQHEQHEHEHEQHEHDGHGHGACAPGSPRWHIGKAPDEVEGDAMERDVGLTLWLGLALDSVPEGLVIGFLAIRNQMGAGFLLGLLLSHFPEALSSADLMRRNGMHWALITALFASVAALQAALSWSMALFFNTQSAGLSHFQHASEGLAGGALLCMISGSAIPEAHDSIGVWTGLIVVLGFLSALIVETLFEDIEI